MLNITVHAEGDDAINLIRLIAGSNLGFALAPQAAAQTPKKEVAKVAEVAKEPATTEAEAPKETAAAKKKREKAEAEAAAAKELADNPAPAAPEVAPPKPGKAEAGGVSLDMIRDKIIAFTKAAGPKAAVALVTETTGATKASAVAEVDYPKLHKALEDALEAAAVAA